MKNFLFILLTFFLYGCLDEINLKQGKKPELKEIKGTTYFISADRNLFEKQKGMFVESQLVDEKLLQKIKEYEKNSIANYHIV